MSRPVPLIRRFIQIPDHYQNSDETREGILQIAGSSERHDWRHLHESYRCVVLADAGVGKTYELIAEAQRHRNRGRKAFFIRIEDIDEAFGSAFEVGTPEEFQSWLSGTDEAWFFLDSVDEVRLETPRAFETAIAAFAHRIHNAHQRAHVCISSRPYAWRPKTDRALVEELLPYKPPVEESTGADSKRQAPSKKDENPGGLALYRLAPLDDDDIRVFAGHRNISDADALPHATTRPKSPTSDSSPSPQSNSGCPLSTRPSISPSAMDGMENLDAL